MHLCLIAALAVMASAFELPRGADARVRSRPSADAARRAAAVGPSPPTSRGRSPRLSETVLATAAGGGAAATADLRGGDVRGRASGAHGALGVAAGATLELQNIAEEASASIPAPGCGKIELTLLRPSCCW